MGRKDELEWLRDTLRQSISDAEPDKRASLANQYRATLADLAALAADEGKAGDPVDELAARRSARGGATARSGRAAGGSS